MTQPTVYTQTRVTETTSWELTEEQVAAILREHLGAAADALVEFDVRQDWLRGISVTQKKVTES